jgi:choline dehydrogenase
MREHFQNVESCQYLPRTGVRGNVDPRSGHGFGGWLPLSMPDPTLALHDKALVQILLRSFLYAYLETHPAAAAAAEADNSNVEPHEKALDAAIADLLRAGQRASEFLPNTARPMYARIKANVDAWRHERARQPAKKATRSELIEVFSRADELLQLFPLALAWLDPNRNFHDDTARVGPFSTPASILHGVRRGVRERILDVATRYPDRLHIFTGVFATQLILEDTPAADGPRCRAVGVRYLEGQGLYQATPEPQKPLTPVRELRVRERGEVIVAGGAFNTPQLLMLSGIGPEDVLTRANVKVACNLPGVGKNLQDRYEVTVVAELKETDTFKGFPVLANSRFLAPGDRCECDPPDSSNTDASDQALQEWMNHRGVYASNGVVMTIIRCSDVAKNGDRIPDLFIFGLPGNFRGYRECYSCDTQSELKDGNRVANHRRFTWAILKGRTHNGKGSVEIASNDPLQRPQINFRYFKESAGVHPEQPDAWKNDLAALVQAVRFVERLVAQSEPTANIIWPPQDKRLTEPELTSFIQQEAWGHHACGTCKIGRSSDSKAVLDGDFRVRGVENLRVVDASVFPKIPGFFIVTSIYMIGEKASKVILNNRAVADAFATDNSKPKPAAWPKAPV